MARSSPHLRIPAMQEDLDRIERSLLEAVQASDPFLTEVASHLIKAGGKRLRPAFCIAAAATGPGGGRPAEPEVIQGGVAVELVHLGSLYHDDVMDDATTRRTVASVNARWGNLKAILAGDFLLARASGIGARLGTEVASLLATTIGRLCEGQIRELSDVYNTSRSEEDYFLSISGKTAALFSTACRVGSLVAGLPPAQTEALTTFGDRYGMAFQIVDDVLDLVSTAAELGKPSGHDLLEGVYTLPVLRALRDSEGEELRGLLGGPLEDETREKVLSIVRGGTAIAGAIDAAETHAREAIAAIQDLPRSDAASGLAATAEHLIDRVRAAAA